VQAIADSDTEPEDGAPSAKAAATPAPAVSSSGHAKPAPSSAVANSGAAMRAGVEAHIDVSAQSSAGPNDQSQDHKGADDDEYVEYVSQFCMYIGVDVAAEPDLITDISAFLKCPLPDGWSLYQTGPECENGMGLMYYVHAASGRSQWTRPDEEDLLRSISAKMKGRPLAGSRIFFTALRDKSRLARWAALEEQVGHLPDVRPLLRALPAGAAQPNQPLLSKGGVVHVCLHDSFPVLHAAAVEAFAAYFGLGTLASSGTPELRQLWVLKLAALCPVPEGWEFRFDETTLAAVFIEVAAGKASRRHPLDAFFAGLLERTLARHRSFEAAETQRIGKQAFIGGRVAFFLDASNGAPYWIHYDGTGGRGAPWAGGGGLPVGADVSSAASAASSPPLQKWSGATQTMDVAPTLAARSVSTPPPLPPLGSQGHSSAMGLATAPLREAAQQSDSLPALPTEQAADSGDDNCSVVSFSTPTATASTIATDITARTEEGAPPAPLRPPPGPAGEASAAGATATRAAAAEIQLAGVHTVAQGLAEELAAERRGRQALEERMGLLEASLLNERREREEQLRGVSGKLEPMKRGGVPLQALVEMPTVCPTAPPAAPPLATAAAPPPDRGFAKLAEMPLSAWPACPAGADMSIAPPKPAGPPPVAAGRPQAPPPPRPTSLPAAKVTLPLEPPANEVSPTKSAQAASLPVLPASQDDAAEKDAPHWSVREGKWRPVGSRLSSDDEEDAETRGGGGGLARGDRHNAELVSLVDRLRSASGEDDGTICEILEKLETVNITVHELRTTQLGVLTQSYKDHPDRRLRTVARRLRKSWKEVVQSAAGASGTAAAVDEEVTAVGAPRLEAEAGHGMAPPADAQLAPPPPPAPFVPKVVGPLVQLARPSAHGGKALSPTAKRKRAELAANLQWLCRLFLETREQLFALHDGTPTCEAVCNGLREELDAVRFRRALEKALNSPPGRPPPRALVRLLRAFGRRALHCRKCSPLGRSTHERFVAACTGYSDSREFVHGAVPRVLQIFARVVEEDRQSAMEGGSTDANADLAAPDGDDPWGDSGGGEDEGAAGTSSNWDVLDTMLEDGVNLSQLEEDADAFMADAAWPTPLRLPDADRREGDGCIDSGSTAPRGWKPHPCPAGAAHAPDSPLSRALEASAPRRSRAQGQYFSGDPVLIAKVARSPLSNLDGLIGALAPGAELVTEGILPQLADDELLSLAHALEQITEAASKRLVRELEVRDELQSTCMHRREYLQLLDGELSHRG